MAAQAGVRAGICMSAVPTVIRSVRARIQAAGVTASEPIGLGSPDRLVAERLRLADQVDVDGEVPARIAEHEPELQHFSSPVAGGNGGRAVTVGR